MQIEFINLGMTYASILFEFQKHYKKENFSCPVLTLYNINIIATLIINYVLDSNVQHNKLINKSLQRPSNHILIL